MEETRLNVIKTEITKLKNSLKEKIPTSPFISDAVGFAMTSLEANAETFEELETVKASYVYANSVADYVKKVSSENFYKYNLVVAAILSLINGKKPFNLAKIETENASVAKALASVEPTKEMLEEYGLYKGTLLHAVNLIKEDNDLLVMFLERVVLDVDNNKGKFTHPISLAWFTESLYPTINKLNPPMAVRDVFGKLLNKVVNVKF